MKRELVEMARDMAGFFIVMILPLAVIALGLIAGGWR